MNGIKLNGKIVSVNDDGIFTIDGKEVSAVIDTTNFEKNLSSDDDTIQKAFETLDKLNTSNTLSSTWKYFDGDGDTTDFDCETNIDIIQVSIDGSFITPRDFDKDDTVISFKEAPEDGAEIDVQIFSTESLLEEYKYFDGDGDTTDFDCEINIDIICVSLDGYMISPRDFSKDGTTISFDEAPEDGVEISVWILKQK